MNCKQFTYTLIILLVAVWGYVFGAMQPQVVYMDSLTPMYDKYLTFRMEEDGSYSATTIDGLKVHGCIDSAICNL